MKRPADGLTPSQRAAQRIGRAWLDADRRRRKPQPPAPEQLPLPAPKETP